MSELWLKVGDRFLFDDEDWRVVEAVIARTQRTRLQALRVVPELGGAGRWLLQVQGEDVVAAETAPPAALQETDAQVGGEGLQLEWVSPANLEYTAAHQPTKFGRGECALYRSPEGAIAARIGDGPHALGFVGRPLEPGRLDLRFTGQVDISGT